MKKKLFVILFVTTGLILAALLVYLGTVDNIDLWQGRSDTGFTRIENYFCREVENADAPVGIMKEYTFTIAETLDSDKCLAFYTVHQYVDVYLGEELVYSLKQSKDIQIVKTVGSNWVIIPLYQGDAGKEVRVEVTPVYENFRDREIEFLTGSQLSIYVNRLYRDLPQLILGVMAVFVGFIFLCIAGYNLCRQHRGKELAALGLFSLMMGFWRLTDTRFTPFIDLDKPVLMFYISVSMLMIGMVPLVKSMKQRFSKVSGHIFDCYCIVAVLICFVQLFLQIFGVMDLRENLSITHLVIISGAVIIIGNDIYDWLKPSHKKKERLSEKLPLICIVGVVADIIAFYLKGNSSGLLFSLLAFQLYIVFMGISMMYNYSEQEKQLVEKNRLLAENERKLTESRIAIMISQIQPHFIYNTLGTIGQFCMEDPQKAADLVQKFSLYLRGNFTELDNSAPIRISQEIEHVRHYVNIEQIRFPDIQIKYDLQANEFVLPALTVQPLVENAIKHGLMGLESGGTIVISTYETDETYCVCVKDDGVGFDESALQDEKKHIGIRNIRGRIEAMCAGTLTIESVPKEGTTALITIPKEGKK